MRLARALRTRGVVSPDTVAVDELLAAFAGVFGWYTVDEAVEVTPELIDQMVAGGLDIRTTSAALLWITRFRRTSRGSRVRTSRLSPRSDGFARRSTSTASRASGSAMRSPSPSSVGNIEIGASDGPAAIGV